MTCSCKELERNHGQGPCKCVHYRETFPDCECERATVSDFSPGPVRNDEILIRTLYSSIHINNQTHEVDPAAFSDVLKRGLSVDRKSYISQRKLEIKAQKKIEQDLEAGKTRRAFLGVTVANCSDIRSLLERDTNRSFCVYDTATEDNCAHADICQAFVHLPGTEKRKVLDRKLRALLAQQFSNRILSAGEVYELYPDPDNPTPSST